MGKVPYTGFDVFITGWLNISLPKQYSKFLLLLFQIWTNMQYKYEGWSINSFLVFIRSLFMGGFKSFSVIINSNLSLIGRKH